MELLKGKTAMVTGGTRGIGFAVARSYLANGASVALCGSRQETVDKALAQLQAENPDWQVIGLCPDLKDPTQVCEAVDTVVKAFGRLDILVNNAGVSSRTAFLDYTAEEFRNVMDLNVYAMFLCSQAAARMMKEQGGGVILNTSSVVSLYGQAAGVAYPTSKFAVNGMTKSLARELAPCHIRVNAVAPGVIGTDMVAALPEGMVQRLAATIPLGRVGEPIDVANAFVYLASDMADYVTGEILSVDGMVMT